MRIGVNCFPLGPQIGGLKQYFLTLLNWLLQHDRANEYVLFHTSSNADELDKLASGHWRKEGVFLQAENEIRPRLASLDLYFCPFGTMNPRPVPLPSVVTLVDIQERFYPRFFRASDLYSRAYHFPAATHAADRVITISEFSKSTIVEHHGLRPEKVKVAYLCADPEYFRAPAIEKAPTDPIPFPSYVFFPGNRWLHKNHDLLLRSMAALKQGGTIINAVFTGYDMNDGYPLMQRAAEYGLREQVYSAGYVSVPEMAYLYSHAELLVFPSLFEGFGMPPVEAMAAGCPVAAASSTCLPEICGDAATYFDGQDEASLGAAIERVRGNADYRSQLIERGRAKAAEYSEARMAQAHLEAFGEAVEGYSRGRFLWQRNVYQPYHLAKVMLQRKLGHFDSKAGEDQAPGNDSPRSGNTI